MQTSDLPNKFPIPFANAAGGGFVRAIPQASQIGVHDGWASLTDGFPPLTFSPVASGGVPPFGQDFNGLLQQITAWSRWTQAGGPLVWDSSFSSVIGGYPNGALVHSSVKPRLFWYSTTDNNTTNPDAGGAGWVAFRSGFNSIEVLTAGTSWTVPSTVTRVVAAVTGGGGGGGASNSSVAGGGGGGGGTSIAILEVTPGGSVSYSVGAGGAGGATGASGTGGGNSNFSTIQGFGGLGGAGGATAGGNPGAAGGGGTGSPLVLTGGYGTDGSYTSLLYGGNGGSTIWGGGGRSATVSSAAQNGQAPGSGAGGAYNIGNVPGGTGANGLIVLIY